MRRNYKDNPKQAKEIARKKYAERQIEKWAKWAISKRGYFKYKELIEQQDKHGIKVYG